MATEEEMPTVKATEELPKESLEGKLGDLNIGEKAPPAAQEPEKFEDSKESPMEETPQEAKESVLEELKEGLPKLHHVGTTDTKPEDSSTDGVVKADVPEAFEKELKSDHDIVSGHTPAASESKEAPTDVVKTVTKEVGAESGNAAPATRETPVEVTHENVDTKPPSKTTSVGEKISETFQKMIGKDSTS